MVAAGGSECTGAITSSVTQKESKVWRKLRLTRKPKQPLKEKQELYPASKHDIVDAGEVYQLLTLPSFSEISLPLIPRRVSRPQKPKHTPIFVPYFDTSSGESHTLITRARDPCWKAPASPDSPTPSISKFQPPAYKAPTTFRKTKPRHVEIVIPIWAYPIHKLRDTPISISNKCSKGKACTESTVSVKGAKMPRRPINEGRSDAMDSGIRTPSSPHLSASHSHSSSQGYSSSDNSSQPSLSGRSNESASGQQSFEDAAQQRAGAYHTSHSPALSQTAGINTPATSVSNVSGLMCNVHHTTGRRPHALVGASTTILGDKLYVFGGRRLAPAKPVLSNAVYELDLIRRHWNRLQTRGQIPSPRYFHSACALGDTKLVCYGGMSLFASPTRQNEHPSQSNAEAQSEMVVMGDVHILEVTTGTWTRIATPDAPQGRYAHCAAVVPSSSVFSSTSAALSAIHHNPSTSNPNQGSIGLGIDGSGGAQLIVVGGQDNLNRYIEQISVFNLRSLKWTTTENLGRACGAYRSVVAPLVESSSVQTNLRADDELGEEPENIRGLKDKGTSVIIYSNYNFQDVKLDLHIRDADGTLTEQPMRGGSSPPGLRFPTGAVINNHLVISGTLLTSSKQEYALWALDLSTLTWSRIDVGGTIFSLGSWNRGVLWRRRNTFVILGNRKRSLVEDYNQRRINFANICMVELEAFGLYENPRRMAPSSGFKSASAPPKPAKVDRAAGGRQQSKAAEQLGQIALGLREICDMDFLAIGGERLPVNSHLVARRWGPYFTQLLYEGVASQEGLDTASIQPSMLIEASRSSTVTITPSVNTAMSNATTLLGGTRSGTSSTIRSSSTTIESFPISAFPATMRPRTLYLPHTLLTLQALTHYLYTSTLPVDSTPQVLCSLLQLARPYRIDGLLEAVIEQLHRCLDGRNTAAIFNAAAMAAGGGDGVRFFISSSIDRDTGVTDGEAAMMERMDGSLRINTDVAGGRPSFQEEEEYDLDAEVSSPGTASTASSFSESSEFRPSREEVWRGGISAVVGLQKRGLRGLMEGRRMRERRGNQGEAGPGGGGGGGEGSLGLGIS